MTVKELIAHLQTFDENAVVVVPIADGLGDIEGVEKIKAGDIEGRGKYVIFFDTMPYSEEELDEIFQ